MTNTSSMTVNVDVHRHHRRQGVKFLALAFACLLCGVNISHAQDTAPKNRFAEFETGLQQYPAGYVLYGKLDEKGKRAVFSEYQKAAEPRRYSAAIRKTIELTVGVTN